MCNKNKYLFITNEAALHLNLGITLFCLQLSLFICEETRGFSIPPQEQGHNNQTKKKGRSLTQHHIQTYAPSSCFDVDPIITSLHVERKRVFKSFIT